MDEVTNVLEYLKYIFEREITDENILRYIFGKKTYQEKMLWQTRSYPVYFNNVLTLAFYFVYACYRCDMDQGYGDMENLTSHNAKRIKSSLENAFVRYPITPDLIQFVLTDVQFELAKGEASRLRNVFSKFCSNMPEGFNFNSYFNIIAAYNRDPARFQQDQEELWSLFRDLLDTLDFLKNYKLVQKAPDIFHFITHRCAEMQARVRGSENRDRNRDHYSDMPMEHLLFLDDSKYLGGIYRLFSLERGEMTVDDQQELILNVRYFTADNKRSLFFSLPEESTKEDSHLHGQWVRDVYCEIVGMDFVQDQDELPAKKNAHSIEQIHAVNYRHVKNLALAISDALSSGINNKTFLYRKFHKEYPYIFERRGTDPDADICEELDWDSVVIMLLIEISPKVVLENIIRWDRDMFYKICANLYARSYDPEKLAVFALDQNSLNEMVNNLSTTKFILGEAEGFGKLPTEQTYRKLFPRAATMLILSKLNDMDEDDTDESLIYTGNLQNNIALLERASTEFDLEKSLRYACIILGETVKHTVCFYEGLFAYGKAKTALNKKNAGKIQSRKALLDQQKKLETEFLKAAQCKAEELPAEVAVDSKAALKMLDLFIAFCKNCTLRGGCILDNSRYLYDAMGKYEIVDLRRFEGMVSRLQKNRGTDTASVRAWVDTTLEILEFFATGSMRDTTMDNDLFNAVYPFTAVFNRRKENQDGYKTVNFSLNIDTDEEVTAPIQQFDINVLSEFVYDRSEVYYCVPNVLRSNYKWWIDPILISFRDFNKIFSNLRKDDE